MCRTITVIWTIMWAGEGSNQRVAHPRVEFLRTASRSLGPTRRAWRDTLQVIAMRSADLSLWQKSTSPPGEDAHLRNSGCQARAALPCAAGPDLQTIFQKVSHHAVFASISESGVETGDVGNEQPWTNFHLGQSCLGQSHAGQCLLLWPSTTWANKKLRKKKRKLAKPTFLCFGVLLAVPSVCSLVRGSESGGLGAGLVWHG